MTTFSEVKFRKLDRIVAQEIRERHSKGETIRSLATEFGVTYQAIRAIILYQTYRLEAVEERFWRQVKPTDEKCLLWTGATDDSGYGLFWVDGHLEKAHRFAWMLEKGSIADGVLLLHSCDTPPCINWRCLFEGDHQSNSDDKIAKGRFPSTTKLRPDQVREIRELRENGATVEVLGNRFGVGISAIYRIVSGRGWKSVQ